MKHNHLKHMLIGGAAVLGGLVLFGVPLATALPYALLLACPLMMMFMMRGMNHEHVGGSVLPAQRPGDIPKQPRR